MKRWLRLGEAASRLAISPTTLRDLMAWSEAEGLERAWVDTRSGPDRRHAYRFAADELDQWFQRVGEARWQASTRAASGTRSGGGTPTAAKGAGSSPPGRSPRSSSARSKKPTRSGAPGRIPLSARLADLLSTT